MRKWKLGIIAAAVILVVAMIIIAVVGMDRDGIVAQYFALSNKPENSAKQFKVPFGYITINDDGTVNIEFATSIPTISIDIGIDDESTDVASGDDDRQNGDGTGTGTNPHPGPGTKLEEDYNLTATDQELIDIFKSIGCSEEKAYGLLACYKACTELGMSTRETIGLLACGCCEGTPGLIQYGHSIGGLSSSSNNPRYLDNISIIDEAIKGNYSKDTGAGTAQWTNGRLEIYAGVVKKYINQYGEGSGYETLWRADYDMYKQELTGSYQILPATIGSHNSTLENILVYSFFRYEAGFGNYKNSDSISSYSGDFKSNLEKRMSWANKLDNAFKNK